MNKILLAPVLLILAATLNTWGAEESKDPAPVLKADDPAWTMDFAAAELLAVQDNGRKKPLQSYAIETIEQLSGRPLVGSTYIRIPTGESGDKAAKFGAMDLYISIWSYPKYWVTQPVILAPNNELRKFLDKNDNPEVTGKWISYKQLRSNEAFQKLVTETRMKKEDELLPFEKEAQLVYSRSKLFESIAASDESLSLIPHPEKNGTWATLEVLAAAVESKKDLIFEREKINSTITAAEAFKAAYRERDAKKFTTASQEFRKSLAALAPNVYPSFEALAREVTYNNVRPFAWAWAFYLVAAILTLLAIALAPKVLYTPALLFYFVGFAMHVYGFTLRCMITGRPPVSNMYESVIWVGSGAVFFGIIFELIYRKKYFMLSGAFGGFLCLVLMDLVPIFMNNAKLPGFDSHISPLPPVLRSNYWLTIHVLTITLSYAAFMLAWGMGHITMWSHLFRPTQRAEHHELHNLIYRIMQVGVLLLAIGTILGGVWAYYSWGRFWGWDPKETWAFIALMCYIVVLHGRFAGYWGNFGIAFGSVFCFLSIVMAWYGVNFVLGKGLHSYGSGAGGEGIVLTLVVLDMIFLAAATTRYQLSKKKALSPAEHEAERISEAHA